MSWRDSIIFDKGEQIFNSWEGNRELTQREIAQSSGSGYFYGPRQAQNAKILKNGVLVLTNQRLLFLEAHGVLSKSYQLALTVPLGKVGGISMGGLLIPFVSIVAETQCYTFHIKGVGKNEFPAFRQAVLDLCQKRRDELEALEKKERIQIVLDFSTLRDYMERGGMVLSKTKCPECNAPISIPAAGREVVCEHCGTKIMAQDVFEKIKELL